MIHTDWSIAVGLARRHRPIRWNGAVVASWTVTLADIPSKTSRTFAYRELDPGEEHVQRMKSPSSSMKSQKELEGFSLQNEPGDVLDALGVFGMVDTSPLIKSA
jgi:hypothetical protein